MKKFFLMLGALLLTATSMTAQDVKGTKFEISANNCELPVPADAARKFTFTSQWSSTSPSPNSFDAAEIQSIMIELAAPLPCHYNLPYKDASGTQKWNAYSDSHSGASPVGPTILDIDLSILGSITDFSIQHTQSSGTYSFIINKSYTVDKAGNKSPFNFQAPGWGGSMAYAGITSGTATFSKQWSGINLSDDIIGLYGKKTLRIYGSGLENASLQWACTDLDDNNSYPAIGKKSDTYAETTIEAPLKSIYLQWTSAESGSISIDAITWEVEKEVAPAVSETTVPDAMKVYVDGEDITAAQHRYGWSDGASLKSEITVLSDKEFVVKAKVANDWDTQLFLGMKEALTADTKVKLSFDAKASAVTSLSTGAHATDDGTGWKAGGVFNAPSLTTEWKTFTFDVDAKSGWQYFSLDLTKAEEMTYEFKNIKIIKMKEAPIQADLVITEAGWATYYAPFAASIPAGVEAYIIQSIADDKTLVLEEVKDVIPAYQPVVVKGALGTYKLSGEIAKAKTCQGRLSGALTEKNCPVGSYVLQKHDKIGFYKVEDAVKVTPFHAYLSLPAADSSVKAFYFDAAATAIEQLTSASEKTIYDLSGRKLNKLQKGINIVNGVKVLVK